MGPYVERTSAKDDLLARRSWGSLARGMAQTGGQDRGRAGRSRRSARYGECRGRRYCSSRAHTARSARPWPAGAGAPVVLNNNIIIIIVVIIIGGRERRVDQDRSSAGLDRAP